MTQFRKYDHIERFGRTEVHDIDIGLVHVFPKLDGTNASVWCDPIIHPELGVVDVIVQCGSRNRTLSADKDNAGFYAWVNGEDPKAVALRAFVIEHPTLTVYGEWLCLSGDTEIRLASSGKRQASGARKGHTMTLKEMYEYQEADVLETLAYVCKDGTRSRTWRPSWWKRNGYPQCYSLLQDTDDIRLQRIVKIVKSGCKEVHLVTTRKGYEIKSTMQHMFWTPTGWKQLNELQPGDCVATTPLRTLIRRGRNHGIGHREVERKLAAVRENPCDTCGSSKNVETHHVDGDWKNNDSSNLLPLCKKCHNKLHPDNVKRAKSFQYDFDRIESIELVGQEECYDICMGAPENSSSFVANGFVVHNCPHTLRTYRDDAWRRFWVFDIFDNHTDKYTPYKDYCTKLNIREIDHIPPLCTIQNPSQEQLDEAVAMNTFQIRDGEGAGEGVVLKNYDWSNRFGRQPWAKIVRSEFKDLMSAKVFGHPENAGPDHIEMLIADRYVTKALVDKVRAKIVLEAANKEDQIVVPIFCEGELDTPTVDAYQAEDYDREEPDWIEWEQKNRGKIIPQLLGTVFYDVVREDLWDAIKRHKNPRIDFKRLQSFCTQRVKELAKDLF